MRYTYILIALAFLSSCCEPPAINNLLVCNQRIDTLPDPPTCRNETKIINYDKAFTVSFNAYSIKGDRSVRFNLYDKVNDKLIDEAAGVLSNFGGPYTSTERCVFFVAHTFELPVTGQWPDTILVEVYVDDKNETYALEEEFFPM